MNKRLVFLLFIVNGAVSIGSSATIHQNAGTRAAPALREGAGARSAAMGNAFTAMSDDANVLWANPSGLARLAHLEILSTHEERFEGITQNAVGVVVPMGEVGAANVRRFGALGVTLGFLDYGKLEGRTAAGQPTADFGAQDRVISVGYGKSVLRGLSIGGKSQFYRLRIADQESTGSAFDVGAQYRAASSWWGVSLLAANLGNDVRFVKEAEPLARSVTGGLVVSILEERWLVTVDVEDPEDDFLRARIGSEFNVNDLLLLRWGYDSSFDIGEGFSGGVGLKIREFEVASFPVRRVMLDYAFSPAGDVGNRHRVSLGLRFGTD